LNVNFGKVSNDYAKYRDNLPSIMFEQLIDNGINFKDLNVIDLGSGSGIFSRDLSKYGADVIGIEPSKELIEEAVSIDKSFGIDNIRYQKAYAEDFTLPDTFPIFTAVRAWHWFERIKVIQNIKKYLDQNGLLVVINSIFKPNSEIARKTFKVLIDNNIELKPAGSHAEIKERRTGFPVNWFDEWENNSFQVENEWQHEYELKFPDEEWCGKIRSVSWLANLEEEKRMKITKELLIKFSKHDALLSIPHQYSIVILRNK
jgi:SAM-dependent methyltransferase